jgi:hypothetical protein
VDVVQKRKQFWEMNTAELAAATREFDAPGFSPPAVQPTAAQRTQFRRWQAKRDDARARLLLSLDKALIEQTDNYAASHGVTFSEVVADALRKLMRKQSA